MLVGALLLACRRLPSCWVLTWCRVHSVCPPSLIGVPALENCGSAFVPSFNFNHLKCPVSNTVTWRVRTSTRIQRNTVQFVPSKNMVLPVCLAQIVYQCLMLHFPLKIVIYVEGSKIRNNHDVDYKTQTSYVNFVTFSFLFSLQNTLLEQEKINLRVE